jgi:hypothetical protein
LTPNAIADERQLAIQKAHAENMVANRLLVQALTNLAKSIDAMACEVKALKA